MTEERLRRPLPLPVALDEGLQRAHQLAAVGALGVLDRREDRVAEQPQRVVVLQREQQLEGAEVAVGGERRAEASPLSASARASSAQRASWKPRRRSAERDRAPGAGGQRLAGLARHARVHARGEREQLVVVGGRQQRAQEAPGGGDQPAAGLLAHRPRERLLGDRRARPAAGAMTSAPARSRSPNGSSRRASSAPLEVAGHQRGQHVAREPPLGVVDHPPAQQLERDDRHRLVQREPVELGQRARRPWPPAATPRAAALGACRPARDRQRQRARREVVGARHVPAPRARLHALAQLGAQRRTTSAPSPARPARRASTSPRASKISAGPPIIAPRPLRHAVQPALGEHDPLQPLVRRQRAPQHGVLLVDELRERLLGDRDERHLVGHLEEREAVLGGRLAQRLRDVLVPEPGAEPEPGQPVLGEPRDVGALHLVIGQLQAGGEQQLAAGQPRRRVQQLGDVHPAHRRGRAPPPRRRRCSSSSRSRSRSGNIPPRAYRR